MHNKATNATRADIDSSDVPAGPKDPPTGTTGTFIGSTNRRNRRSKRKPRPRADPLPPQREPETTPETRENALADEPDAFIGPLPEPRTPRPYRRRPRPRRDPTTRPEPPACLAGLLVDSPRDGDPR